MARTRAVHVTVIMCGLWCGANIRAIRDHARIAIVNTWYVVASSIFLLPVAWVRVGHRRLMIVLIGKKQEPFVRFDLPT